MGTLGLQGVNGTILSPNLYIINGSQELTDDDTTISVFAQCNTNDLPISGGIAS